MRALTLPLLLAAPLLAAQTGPGGVGGSATNILWLRADSGVQVPTFGVQQWTDMSGNGNHAVQTNGTLQPLRETNVINGMPAVLFDNDQTHADRLTIPDNATLEGMNGLTAFAVYRLNTGTALTAPRGIFSKRNDPGSQNAYGWFLWNSGGNLRPHLDIDGTGDRLTGNTDRATGTTYVDGFAYHGAAPSNANDQTFYAANTSNGNRQETSTSIPNYTSDLHIGVLYGHTGTGVNTTRFNGHIAEVVLYNTVLNGTQRTIVFNYLAAKYGLALGTGDLYTQDNPGAGNYDHDMAGIGRTSSTDLHTAGRGSGVVLISKAGHGGLQDNEFLLWGHDGGALGTWGVGDLPTGVQGRWQRVWRVSEVDASGSGVNVGDVDLSFDLNGLGAVTASHLRLLVDTDNDGLFADETPITGAISDGSGMYRFAGVSALQNNRRFTLGTTNLISTPLPVELVHFSADPAGPTSVRLSWATASEQDNAGFAVERSTDLEDWTAVAQVAGAGDAQTLLSYEALDEPAPPALLYYRLRQTDLDGGSTLSAVVPVDLRGRPDIVLIPNPADGPVDLVLPSGSAPVLGLDLVDGSGRVLRLSATPNGADRWRFDATALAPGAYVLRVHQAGDGPTRQLRLLR